MNKLIKGLASLALAYASTSASAAVIYEWQSGGNTIGYLSLKDTVASYDSAWSVASGESFINLVAGGYSGFLTYNTLTNSWESPVSGDLTVINDFGSNNGSELDYGYLEGSVMWANGSIMSDLTLRLSPLQDAFTFDAAADGIGNPFVVNGYAVSSVPVPAAIWLFGSGLLGLIGVARRKKS
jgi:hypothetical protein